MHTVFKHLPIAREVFLLSFFLVVHSCVGQLLPIRVSNTHHLLETTDGRPFFWLGDTGWELFHQLNRAEATTYFQKRAEQGFNVIQAVALPELDGLHTPNANGDLPFMDTTFSKPNEKYFAYIDSMIDVAASYGLYIALLPTWGDKVYKDWWGKGPEIFHAENIYAYGRWIGARFRNKTNLIWIIGGDRDPRPGSADVAVWRALAKGVTEGVGGADKALMTFHPQPKGTGSSSQWFQQDGWLDLNMLQTGHCRDTEVWETVSNDYNRTPGKPVVNGENIYEEMPVCFNPKELGYANAYDVRKSAYLSVFAGACGHTYGCGPVIFFGPKGSNFFAALHGWKEALDFPGANEMKYLRRLVESRPMADRVPAQGMLGSEGGCGAERIQATRGKDYAFVYSAYGRDISIRANAGLGSILDAGWYDPRTGKTKYIGAFDNSKALSFTPPLPEASPVPSQREDWVLILDDAAAKRWH
ncbi:MAG TPA: glycoside hydrolase family 140 protein [Puia sp.]|uniref:glycoside hydrolase family 140 protein n=1 Tax=Puia sp. TaxID=2045100 RepID=UPI002CAB64B8|nr:glycoside hydrolase family 140 protein [Puia sp.]HVU94008.1 glycoside hydrolase family 140 protein [Puia sp.]